MSQPPPSSDFHDSVQALSRSMEKFPRLPGTEGLLLIPYGPAVEEGRETAIISKRLGSLPELEPHELVGMLLLLVQNVAGDLGVKVAVVDGNEARAAARRDSAPPRTPTRPSGRRPRRHG